MNNSKILSWMNPKLEIRDTDRYGKGVFAARKCIEKDEMLFVMGGNILTIDDENKLRGELEDKPIEISEQFSIGPKTIAELHQMPQHFVNHSCEPNAGFKGQIFMVAMRPITASEEITYDYAMVMHPNPNSNSYFSMECQCGAASCRNVVSEDDWRNPILQERYDGYFQWFLQEKLLREKLHRS